MGTPCFEGLRTLRIKALTERMPVEEVMRCLLGLSRDEVRTYFMLLNKSMTVDEIAEALGKSKPTAYRIAVKLTKMGLLVRRAQIMERGGYYYKYEAVEPETVKRGIQEVLNVICKKVLEALSQDFAEVRKRLASQQGKQL
ncbi:MAG: helix-turn-helix domain-containing protein [Candidatus Nezhaarchaeales archaeon]